MNIIVNKPGPLTTLQDLGRYGYQKYGVLVTGAMDSFSLRLANILVGNKPDEGALEMTIAGATLVLPKGLIFALTGADLDAKVFGQKVPRFRPIYVQEECILTMGFAKEGCRGYLAVSGGFAVKPVMNSKSTYLRAKLGGFAGRPLAAKDVLPVNEHHPKLKKFKERRSASHAYPLSYPMWSVPSSFIFGTDTIKVTKGLQYDWFDAASIENFFSSDYLITMASDRMGYRLEGAKLAQTTKHEMISEAVTFGSIQVPADGNPIALLADRQTAGGYAKIGQIILSDLPRMAQRTPGTKLRFELVSNKEAERLYLQQEDFLKQLATAINNNLQ